VCAAKLVRGVTPSFFPHDLGPELGVDLRHFANEDRNLRQIEERGEKEISIPIELVELLLAKLHCSSLAENAKPANQGTKDDSSDGKACNGFS
jgi:hypothetical protein